MIIISLIIFLMMLSALAKGIAILLGIPQISTIIDTMNSLTLMVMTVKYVGILLSFLYQQYERSRNDRRRYVRS